VTSERNGKEQTRTLVQQKNGELKKASGPGKGKKQKNQKPTQLGQGLQLGSYKWLASKQENWAVRWAVPGQSCPSSGVMYLLALRSDTLSIGPCAHRDRDYHIMKVLPYK
jgi:hypothetical protein